MLASKPRERTSAVAPPAVQAELRRPGRELDPVTRAIFEPRFGHDFSRVRVHDDAPAVDSARAAEARAYAAGDHVVFGAGEFAPGTRAGRALIAHELAHVVQHARYAVQHPRGVPHVLPLADPHGPSESEAHAFALDPRRSLARLEAPVVSRAVLHVGNVDAQIDYGDLIDIPASGYVAAIESRYRAYAGADLDAATVAQITAFTSDQQQWLLFGLDVLSENTAQAPSLDAHDAFTRLIARAPASTTHPLGTASTAFEREVLTVSGWFEIALSRLTPLAATDLAVTDPLLNPPSAPTAPPGGVFDVATFTTELTTRTRARILNSSLDPANWQAGVAPQSLTQVQSVADAIQARARTFFAPYADTARDNRWLAGWQYSANIHSVTTDPAGNPAPVTQADRLNLLRNRARGVGNDASAGPSLFSRTNFDEGANAADFEAVMTALEADPTVQASLDRQVRHTGRLERPSLQVGISTEVDAGAPECQTRWTTIRTLCHELMHSLAHPDFVAGTHSSPRFPSGVNFNQVLVEGFAEVLGVQLFNNLRVSAGTDAALLASLTQGVTGTCNPPTTVATPGYRSAGANAEAIRQQVQDDRFRAAYFLGRIALIGL
jgi:Domain of unknown function (DUF4157)